MGKGQGNDWRLRVSDTAPSADFDPADTVWDLVGFETDAGISLSKDLIESADKNQPYNSTYVSGRRDSEVSVTVFAEEQHSATDEGQETLWTTFLADDQTLYFLLSNDVSGDQALQAEAYVSDLEFTATDNEMVEIDTSLQVTGAVKRGSTV